MNGIFIRKFDPSTCVFCKGSGKSTGEHLIKRSILAKHQKSPALIIPNPALPGQPRIAQGPKSKAYHFDARVCADCNSSRFQATDRAFEEIHSHLAKTNGGTEKLKEVLHTNSSIWGDAMFRYFSRMMTLQIAQKKGPTFSSLARYSINQTSRNRIWIDVKSTADMKRETKTVDTLDNLGHGGLATYSQEKTFLPMQFLSYLTIPPVHYAYYFDLHWCERLEIRLIHRTFREFCKRFQQDPQRLQVGENFAERYGR